MPSASLNYVDLTLTWVLAIFSIGFLLHRHSSVRIAAVVCLLLGALLARDWLDPVVHTLDGVFNSIV